MTKLKDDLIWNLDGVIELFGFLFYLLGFIFAMITIPIWIIPYSIYKKYAK